MVIPEDTMAMVICCTALNYHGELSQISTFQAEVKTGKLCLCLWPGFCSDPQEVDRIGLMIIQ